MQYRRAGISPKTSGGSSRKAKINHTVDDLDAWFTALLEYRILPRPLANLLARKAAELGYRLEAASTAGS
jgi:hypothetical protein